MYYAHEKSCCEEVPPPPWVSNCLGVFTVDFMIRNPKQTYSTTNYSGLSINYG